MMPRLLGLACKKECFQHVERFSISIAAEQHSSDSDAALYLFYPIVRTCGPLDETALVILTFAPDSC